MENLVSTLKKAIAASHPFVYVQSDEEITVLETVEENTDNALLLCYDRVNGLRWLNKEKYENKPAFIDILNLWDDNVKDLEESFSYVKSFSQKIKTIFAIFDFPSFVKPEDAESSKVILRWLKDISNLSKMGEVNLTTILVSPEVFIPTIIEKDVIIIELKYPSRTEIWEILQSFLNEYDISIPDDLKNRFVSALQGLSRTEIENLLHIALFNNYTLDERDVELFEDYKKQIVKKNAIVEFVDLRGVDTNLGGLNSLKEWLNRKRKIFEDIDKAKENGVDIPKGVLLFGMPGCGKSLAAKYAAKLMNLPLLRLDMGRIMGQYLGQSEENLRKAIKVAESVAPSILWIDEIEKALHGVQGGTSNDTLARIFGTLLTWMQEKTDPVFVIATANDITMIPPEFLRKGRFDEIFFVDFPDEKAMKEILKIHITKRKKKTDSINLEKIVKKLNEKLEKFNISKKKGYSGADIEAIVSEAVENVFLKGKEELTTEDILKVVEKSKPIAKVLKEKIEALRKFCEKIDAKPAD